MDSFFSGIVKAKFNSREHQIKQTIIETLSDNGKEIQYELKEGLNDEVGELGQCDNTQSLCATIEAIFLHGLKDSFLWQTISILAGTGNEVNRRPSPTFWAPLLIFSHKYAIEQIHSMSQINTEVGYCRCWIRQSLNDCLLSSYLANMRRNPQALATYYQRTAFIRDPDFMELAESLIGGIEACVSFQLPLNSSLLNQWTDLPLQLSGLYTPPIQTVPIASGIDVVNSGILSTTASPAKVATEAAGIQGEDIARAASSGLTTAHISIPKPLQTNEFFASSIHNSPFKESAMLTRKNPFMKPYVDVDDIEEGSNVDLGIDCNSTIDDDIENDVQLTALLSRVDALEADNQSNSSTCETKVRTENRENKDKKRDDPTTASKNDIEVSPKGDNALPSETVPSVMGNSILSKTCWSSTEETFDPETRPALDHSISVQSTATANTLSRSNSNNSAIRSPIDKHSYNSLLRRGGKDKTSDGPYSRQIDFNDVWERFENSLIINIGNSSAEGTNKSETSATESAHAEDGDDGLVDFELVQAENLGTKFSIAELQEMVQQTFKIPHELGLDAQNFACLSCGNPLGVGGTGQTTTQVCGFNGSYYCSGCMATDLYQIPARVIFNWDFRKYPVSQKVAAFLQEYQYQSFIDLKLLNPDIYQYVDEMAELQSLRIQLNFIRAYLFTCCAPIVEKLRKQLWTKEYLYEHIHRYTLDDLQRIPKRMLADQLRKVVTFGRQHILDCALCSQKGFICEICQSNKVLFPFDIDTTYKCDDCGAVFHAHCLNAMRPCPRCERKRRRDDLLSSKSCSQTADHTEDQNADEQDVS